MSIGGLVMYGGSKARVVDRNKYVKKAIWELERVHKMLRAR